jgi:hypothetical protein
LTYEKGVVRATRTTPSLGRETGKRGVSPTFPIAEIANGSRVAEGSEYTYVVTQLDNRVAASAPLMATWAGDGRDAWPCSGVLLPKTLPKIISGMAPPFNCLPCSTFFFPEQLADLPVIPRCCFICRLDDVFQCLASPFRRGGVNLRETLNDLGMRVLGHAPPSDQTFLGRKLVLSLRTPPRQSRSTSNGAVQRFVRLAAFGQIPAAAIGLDDGPITFGFLLSDQRVAFRARVRPASKNHSCPNWDAEVCIRFRRKTYSPGSGSPRRQRHGLRGFVQSSKPRARTLDRISTSWRVSRQFARTRPHQPWRHAHDAYQSGGARQALDRPAGLQKQMTHKQRVSCPGGLRYEGQAMQGVKAYD